MLEKSILNELQLIKGFLALILKTLEGKDIPNHSQTLEEQNGHSLGTSSDSDNNIKPSRSERGCGNIIGKTKEGFRKFCGVHGLCPKCQNLLMNTKLVDKPKDNNIKPSRSERGCGKKYPLNDFPTEWDFDWGICGVDGLCPKCQDKYTKKYSKRNGIHQVGLKEDKQ